MRTLAVIFLVLNVGYCIWGLLNHSYMAKHAMGSQTMAVEMVGDKLLLPRDLNEAGVAGSESQLSAVVSDKGVAGDCYEIGPLRESDGAPVSRLLAAYGKSRLEQRLLTDQTTSAYWVYLKGDGTKVDADTKQKELLQKNIDSFVITEGDLLNSISLGVFDKQDNAIKRKNDLLSQGYMTEIKQMVKPTTENWLLFEADENQRRQADALVLIKKIIPQYATSGNLKKIQCAPIGSKK